MACTDPLGPILSDLLDCLTVTLTDCEAPACSYFLSAAPAPAFDDCCDCGVGEGQAWVALQNVTPQNADTASACGFEYLATVQLGVLRCAVTLDENGNAPPAGAITAEAQRVWLDAALMRQAILCCFEELRPDRDDYTLGVWTPLPPQGGCVGGTQSVQVRFSGCRCG